MLYTTFTVKENEYKCRLTAKACVDLEKRMGTNPLNIFTKIAQNSNTIPNLEDLIVILHASLQAYNHKISLDDVYEIYDAFVDEGNTMLDLVPIILDIFKVSGFFKEEEVEEEGKN